MLCRLQLTISINKGVGSKDSDKVVSKYSKTTLRSRKKSKGYLTGEKTIFSRAGKQQGVPAFLERLNDSASHINLSKVLLK